MCGVFGFVSKNGKTTPDLQALKVIAKVTESRGPHAFGFAWIDGRNRLRSFKQTGRISDALGILEMLKDARMMIGHCRYATHGSPQHNINNHPHPADGGWIVHNGVVGNYMDLMAERDYWPTSECDSEVLGLMIEDSRQGGLLLRCVDAVDSVAHGSPLVMLGLWPSQHGGRLVAIRRGNPLHLGRTERSIYFASLPKGLPGAVNALGNTHAVEFRRQKDGSLKHVAASVLV